MSQNRPPRLGQSGVLVGRDDELRHLRDFVDQLRIQGEPLLLSGDAGVGKTMLLDAAAQYARAQGYRVAYAAGVEFEADVSFAALHLVLQPLLGELKNLGEWHRDALTTALGLREGRRSDQLLLSNATLAVLAAAASNAPLLLIVDDLPWIDRASAAVLGFVARRLSQIPVGLLAASRTSEDSLLDQAGLPTRIIPPLTDTAAHALLARSASGCTCRTARSPHTCTRSSRNSASLRGPRYAMPCPAAKIGRRRTGGADAPTRVADPVVDVVKAGIAARVGVGQRGPLDPVRQLRAVGAEYLIFDERLVGRADRLVQFVSAAGHRKSSSRSWRR
jgi:AAA ATPase domain